MSYYEWEKQLVRISSENQQVEIFDHVTQTWRRMNKKNTSSLHHHQQSQCNNNKRKYEQTSTVVECNVTLKKRQKYSFDSLHTELVIEILSYCEYVVVKLPLIVKEFFGRFADGTIHPLYYNFQLLLNKRLSEENLDLQIMLKHVRKLNCVNTISANMLLLIYKNCHSLTDLYLQYVDSGAVDTDMDERIYTTCHKVRSVTISDRHDMLLLPHLTGLKFVRIEDCAKCKVIQNVLVKGLIGNLNTKCLVIDIRNQTECDLLMNELEKNKFIQHLDVISSEDANWIFNPQFLRTTHLKSILAHISVQELEAISLNPNIENIQLSEVTDEILSYLKRMKSLSSIRYYVHEEESYIEEITLLSKLNLKSIMIWKTESDISNELIPLIQDSNTRFDAVIFDSDREVSLRHIMSLH
jgi:hypothetical protein